MINVKNWKNNLEIARKSKDEFFGSSHPQSPIFISTMAPCSELQAFGTLMILSEDLSVIQKLIFPKVPIHKIYRASKS